MSSDPFDTNSSPAGATEGPQLDRQKLVRAMAAEVCERNGLLLYDLEIVTGSRGRGRAIRVFVDKKDGGAGVEDCANVSRGLGLLLDNQDPFPDGHYDLEVSTPGLERALRERWHFEAVIGSQVEIKTRETVERFNPGVKGLEGRKTFTGVLEAVVESGTEVRIRIRIEPQVLEIPLSVIHKARKHVPFEVKSGAPQKQGLRGQSSNKREKDLDGFKKGQPKQENK